MRRKLSGVGGADGRAPVARGGWRIIFLNSSAEAAPFPFPSGSDSGFSLIDVAKDVFGELIISLGSER